MRESIDYSATGRICRGCEEFKPWSEFYLQRGKPRSQCKACIRVDYDRRKAADPDFHRWHMLKHQYGIDKAEYMRLFEQQDGRCAICGADKDEAKRRSYRPWRWWLHVDHDHENGRVRGLLCFRCNTGLGCLPTPERLSRAIAYLQQAEG